MNMFLRTILMMLASRRHPAVGLDDVARVTLRVVPSDLDILGHMNNGVYLSYMDLGRFNLLTRSGVWGQFRARGWYPVVASETITFRRSLQLWQKFVLETRIVGYDDRAVYVEQRFVVDGEIYAQGFIRGRFLSRSGGTVSLEQLGDVVGGGVGVRRLAAAEPEQSPERVGIAALGGNLSRSGHPLAAVARESCSLVRYVSSRERSAELT